jgi:hypothetical protein
MSCDGKEMHDKLGDVRQSISVLISDVYLFFDVFFMSCYVSLANKTIFSSNKKSSKANL